MKTLLNKNHWLFNRPIAHRGLANTVGYVENTMPAFINSMQKGYAIETDVRLDKQKNVYCFHDKTLSRLTNDKINFKLGDLTKKQINVITLINGEKICSFKELLQKINGKVPLVIELKHGEDKILVDKTIELLKNYKGEFVLKSFDFRLVKRVRKLAPNFICGQLIRGSAYPKFNKAKWNIINAFTKPHFVSHTIDTLSTPYRNTICWTVATKEQYKKAQRLGINVVFEGEENIKN